MIPKRLELTAFGPFVKTQVVDFERLGAHGLFLIHGPTGAGKSALLDALTYALFGDTSGGGRDGEDMVTSLAPGLTTSVALEFSHQGRAYRVERSPRQRRAKKRGEGFTNLPPSAELYELLAGSHKRLVAEGKDRVTAAVKELLHCDARQFRQTVVLPQGQFRQVIEDDDTRSSTLAQLFDTARFVRIQEQLAAYAKDLRGSVTAAEGDLADLRSTHEVPDLAGLEGRLAAALKELAGAEAADKAAAGALKLAIETHTAAKRLAKDFEELASTRAEIATLTERAPAVDGWRAALDADRRARDAQSAVAAWRAAQRAAGDREEALAQAEIQLAEATALRTAAAARLAEHELGRPQRDAAASTAGRLELLKPDLESFDAARGKVADAEQALATATAAAVTAKESLAKLEELRAANDAGTAAAQTSLDALADAGTALAAATGRAKAAKAVHAASKTLADLGADAADLDLSGLWQPLAHALAARLEPGEPCPVCGATDHPGREHDAAGGRAAPAVAELEAALQAAQEGRLVAANERAAATERLKGGLEDGGWASVYEVPEPAAAAAEVEAAQAARDRAQELRDRLKTLRTEREQISESLAAANKGHAAATSRQQGAEIDLAAARATLRDLAARLDERYRADPTAFALELDAALAAVTSFDESARSLGDAAAAADRSLAAAGEKQRLATAELRASVEAAEKTGSAAERALKRFGFVTADGTPDSEGQRAALLEDDARDAVAEDVKEHDEALLKAKAREQQLDASTDGRTEPDLAALQLAEEEATAQRNAAAEAAEAARRTRDSLSAAAERWRELERGLGESRAKHRTAAHLADLVTGKVTGRFRLDLETYVLRRILDRVLVLANRHLDGMTGGRFQLRLNESEDKLHASGLRLDVEDRYAGGQRRRVATLSGGEGFQASLALALGLAETAQRTSGAVEVGALFVDEGFGSLDSATLAEVVSILRRLPTDQRRMVGVITHVDALKGRIAAQLEVVSGAGDGSGSSVRHSFG